MYINSRFSIIATDLKGHVSFLNKSALKLLNCDKSAVKGKQFSNLIYSVDSPDYLMQDFTSDNEVLRKIDFEQIVMHKDQLKGSGYECLLYRENKSLLPIRLTISELKDKDKQSIGYLCTLIDIGPVLNIRKSLKQKDLKFRHLFESSGDGIFLLKDFRVIDCNAEAARLFGSDRENLIGSHVARYSPAVQHDGVNSNDKANAIISKIVQYNKHQTEWELLKYDGTPFIAEVTLSVVEPMEDDEMTVMACMRDISDRKQSERELMKTREQLLSHNLELALINDLSNKLHATTAKEDIYKITMQAMLDYPGNPRVAIYEVDESNTVLNLVDEHGSNPGESEKVSVLPINPDFIGNALETGEMLYSGDILHDDRILPKYRDLIAQAGLHSVAIIPLTYLDEKVAVIILSYASAHVLDEQNLDILRSIGKAVSLALINAEKHRELNFIAKHDDLTGLPNRSNFHEFFENAMENNRMHNAALFLFDLDRFKEINDTLGHFTGDLILKEIGPRLQAMDIDKEFDVCRLGGDEFILFANDVSSKEEAKSIVKKILAALNEPFSIKDLNLSIEASVGIALFPHDGLDNHALLRSADVAMYNAKTSARSYMFYETSDDKYSPERLTMIAELSSSIKSGQLFLHYQPKMDLITKDIKGFEVLARWEHPKLGMLSPAMFIPLIEMSNSIFEFTEEILNQALAQQQQWIKNGQDYTIAVNISARNLIDNRLVKLLKVLLEKFDADPSKIELEITETAIMHDAYKSTEYLTQISDLGIKLSIDDFGTGYSSLAYLRNLPINKLKLDRSFIMDMLKSADRAYIVETIIKLAKALELEVIAEGVEDEVTLNNLKKMQCDTAQGYFICKPNNWDEIEHWLKRRTKMV
ncbi:MAG: EAL domain-containing protein [Gammaproteobacteria bacterium]|nr:EAL domain-containing protein [Gammaproteobacteria bacterium]